MRGIQIKNELLQGKHQGKEFINWWRKENDFADFELIDRYLDTLESRHEIDNFDLLDKNRMWTVLKHWKASGLRCNNSPRSAKIEWQHLGKNGWQHTDTCPCSARNIISIFDAETRGDTTD